MSSPAEITSSSLSDAASIHSLEAHVESQLRGSSPYDFAANKYLLKLYSCFPEATNSSHVASVLILSMMSLPSKDLLAVASLLPSGQDADSRVQVVLEATRALEGGQFRRFWDVVKGSSEVFSIATGFEDALRVFIFGAICDTFRSLSTAEFSSMLNFHDQAAVSVFCQQHKARITSVS
jgi:hypothetical protein